VKVNLSGVSLPQGLDPKIGNLYAGKGGRNGPAYWLVIARTPSKGCVLLGLDSAGDVVSAANYNSYAMKDRLLLGVVAGIDELTFDIEDLSGGDA